jgi:hypothetical protein
METAAINKTLVQLILSDEILELLQQARPDTSLHINALDGKGT